MRPRLLMNFTLRCVRFYPGVNSRAELVTLAPGLRPARRFAPLARGLIVARFLVLILAILDVIYIIMLFASQRHKEFLVVSKQMRRDLVSTEVRKSKGPEMLVGFFSYLAVRTAISRTEEFASIKTLCSVLLL